jgi:hypothetical protein
MAPGANVVSGTGAGDSFAVTRSPHQARMAAACRRLGQEYVAAHLQMLDEVLRRDFRHGVAAGAIALLAVELQGVSQRTR